MTAPERIWADWQETFGSVEQGTWADRVKRQWLYKEKAAQ